MKYTAPDGHVIISDPNGPVTYTCSVSGMIEGSFDSLETKSASNQWGIQQIHINRVITEDSMAITIRESTDQEIQDYLASIERLAVIDSNGNLNIQ